MKTEWYKKREYYHLSKDNNVEAVSCCIPTRYLMEVNAGKILIKRESCTRPTPPIFSSPRHLNGSNSYFNLDIFTFIESFSLNLLILFDVSLLNSV